VIGPSDPSDAGGGATILKAPDAVTYLVEDVNLRTKTDLGLTWKNGADLGGDSNLIYTVRQKNANGVDS
jgi:hypothetical protein